MVPVLGESVIMCPNTATTGAGQIKNGSVISQGVNTINRETSGDGLVCQENAGELTFLSKAGFNR